MTRPRLLDLYCGAGGAAMGYHRAGFDVVGVDNKPQPHYPFRFIQADAITGLENWVELTLLTGKPDAIHASPPCQRYTALRSAANHRPDHPDLIDATRRMLDTTGLPYVIENVLGAPMRCDIQLCGTMFGLGVDGRELRRHRLFEANFPMLAPSCQHRGPVLGIYGDHARLERHYHPDRQTQLTRAEGLAAGREAMGMPWADWAGLKEAIPPAYTEHIGRQLLEHIQVAA